MSAEDAASTKPSAVEEKEPDKPQTYHPSVVTIKDASMSCQVGRGKNARYFKIGRLKQAGVRFGNQTEEGPGGKQILIEDPDGNPIELHEYPPPKAP